MQKIKKIIASLTMVGLLVVAAPVGAMTAEEMATQIAALQNQLTELMAQYQTLTGTPATGTVACTFTRNLYPGMSGSDVKCLQEYLNSAGHTVSATGAGSPGNETLYFGPRTQAAVKVWQDANGVAYGAYGGYFGPVSRAKFAAVGTTPTTPTTPTDPTDPTDPTVPATEGTLAATAAATPPTAQTLYMGQENVAIAGINVKALGSDIKLNRLDINFGSRPWLNVSTITIADGTTDVMTYDVTEAGTIEVTAGSSYLVRITNLNVTVPNNTTKTLTIKVTPKLVAGGTSATITYHIPANALRGTDGVGIQQYAPSTALTARTFNIGTASGALALSANASNPVERAVIGSATAVTENVELLRFDLKATINDVIVTKITTDTVTDTSTTTQTLKLYDGDTLLAATSTTSGSAHVFEPLNLRVSKDTTKTLSIKADLNIVTAGKIDASTSVSILTTGITAQDSATYSTVAAGGSTATGKNIWVYTAAPSLALDSASIATTREGRTEGSNTISAIGKIKFNVTAKGGNIYLGLSTTGSGITPGVPTAASTSLASSAYSSNAEVESNAWLVRENETKWFEVTSVLTNTTIDDYFTYLRLTNVKFGTEAGTSTAYTWAWDSIPLEYRTGDVYLQDVN